MVSLTQQVWKHIEGDIVLRRALEKGIISQKNLAVYLLRSKRLQGDTDAIISAIRRYHEDSPLEKRFEAARDSLRTSHHLRLRTNVVTVTLEKTPRVQKILHHALEGIDYGKGELFLITQGEQSLKIVVDEMNLKKMVGTFAKKEILSITKDIAQISILHSEDAVKTPGILSVITSELMLHDVNLVEIVSCIPELFIFVKQKDAVRSYEIISNLVTG